MSGLHRKESSKKRGGKTFEKSRKEGENIHQDDGEHRDGGSGDDDQQAPSTEAVVEKGLFASGYRHRYEMSAHSSNDTKQRRYYVSREYLEFLHLPDERFTDFTEVRKEIVAATDREAADKAISSKPINLRLYSPHVLQLTLVDLPGMTKVPVGNQPENIEQLIRDLILEYIEPENTLILAVTPATEDLANSDALKLARQVDPNGLEKLHDFHFPFVRLEPPPLFLWFRLGERTIGVLTKLDLMDRGTDARDVLENKVFPLKRGYIGTVNRSQAEITSGTDMYTARDSEDKFFVNHPAYNHEALANNYYLVEDEDIVGVLVRLSYHVPVLNEMEGIDRNLMEQVGTRALQRVLKRQLEEHIKEKLPGIRSNMIQKKSNLFEQLQILGALENRTKSSNSIFHQVMAMFARSVKRCLVGFTEDVDITEIQLGAVINETLNDEIINGLLNVENLMPSKEEVMTAMRNLVGVHNYTAPPQQALRRMVHHLTKKFEEPMKMSVEIIAEHTGRAIEKFASQEIGSFPNLKQEVLILVMEKLKQNELSCKELLVTYIEAERAFMNDKHPHMKQDDISTFIQISATGEGKENGGKMNPRSSPIPPPKIPKGTQKIHQGFLSLPGESAFRRRKQAWFTLTPSQLTAFEDSQEDKELLRLNNEEIRIVATNETRRSRKKFIISSIDGRPLGKGSAKEIEVTYDGKDGKEAGEQWESKFREAGIQIENFGSTVSLLFALNKEPLDPFYLRMKFYDDRADNGNMLQRRSLIRQWSMIRPRKIEFHQDLKKDGDDFAEKILRYMRIVRETIRDLTPKYIILKLINMLIKYIEEELVAEIQERNRDIDQLMEPGGDEEMKRRHLLSLYEATQEAVKIINSFTLSNAPSSASA
ncbi:unnamed protein product [Darwinula stevensoni]|uniref:dynamin GTPase n=1 Tax=Darwinula stevensoni TaxID=69355 RepID=A0A7R9A5P4_9CRUS|nr:unnamed protein product [Darwinula stevensoni]CAG0892482.1 unnamed protein product [Darwinula stevensoni]